MSVNKDQMMTQAEDRSFQSPKKLHQVFPTSQQLIRASHKILLLKAASDEENFEDLTNLGATPDSETPPGTSPRTALTKKNLDRTNRRLQRAEKTEFCLRANLERERDRNSTPEERALWRKELDRRAILAKQAFVVRKATVIASLPSPTL